MTKWTFKKMEAIESGEFEVTISGKMTLAEVAALLLKTDLQDDSFDPDFGTAKKQLPEEGQ